MNVQVGTFCQGAMVLCSATQGGGNAAYFHHGRLRISAAGWSRVQSKKTAKREHVVFIVWSLCVLKGTL